MYTRARGDSHMPDTAQETANVNGEPMITYTFRHLRGRRKILQAIGSERGHEDLSATLRDAVDSYIDRYLRSSLSKGENSG